LVYRNYVFSCEDLDIFHWNIKDFPRISGSTYVKDGNRPVFQKAVDDMKVLVGL
jgi:hypothetical protein